jgi:hypothetical protein
MAGASYVLLAADPGAVEAASIEAWSSGVLLKGLQRE